MMEDKTKRVLKFLLRILITGLLLAVVFSRIDLRQLGGAVQNARWLFLFIVWALSITGFWLQTLKMQIVLRKQQCEVDIGTVFGVSAVTTLYGLIMPSLLSTSVKWYILKCKTGRGTNVFSSMAYNQVTDMVVRILVGLLAVIVTNPGGGPKSPILCAIIAVVMIIGLVLMLNRWTGEKFLVFVRYILRPFPEMIRKNVGKILEQIKVFQTASLAFHLLIVTISLLGALLSVMVYVFAAKAAAIDVSPVVLAWQSVVIFLLGRLPISVANLGVREFTLIEFLALYGVKAPVALLMSMIIFSSTILLGVIGAGFQVVWMLGSRVSKESD